MYPKREYVSVLLPERLNARLLLPRTLAPSVFAHRRHSPECYPRAVQVGKLFRTVHLAIWFLNIITYIYKKSIYYYKKINFYTKYIINRSYFQEISHFLRYIILPLTNVWFFVIICVMKIEEEVVYGK